jgi:hypothetical protein
MSEELKVCPFCGGNAKIEEWQPGDRSKVVFRVNCVNDHSLDWWTETPDEAILIWNIRPIEAALTAERDAIRSQRDFLLQECKSMETRLEIAVEAMNTGCKLQNSPYDEWGFIKRKTIEILSTALVKIGRIK